MIDYEALRQRMVDHQLRPSEVTDHKLIRAFETTPRENFVAPADRPFAYGDKELEVSEGAARRLMMPPVQIARMLQALRLDPNSVVMILGCGTGYSAAIAAQLAGSVVAVEEDDAMVTAGERRLRDLGIDNAVFVQAKLVEGYPSEAPYDAILIDGAIEILPDALVAQLRAGGPLAVIERQNAVSRAMLYERVGTEAAKWPLFEAWAAILPGFEKKPEFVF